MPTRTATPPAARPVPAAQLASTLRVAVTRLSRRLRYSAARERTVPLTLTQAATLGTLDRHGPMSPGELAAHEKVQPPSMTRTLAGLEALRLITRTPHPTDGRQQLVALTPDARALIKEDRRRREEWLARRLAELSAAERATLQQAAAILERLAAS